MQDISTGAASGRTSTMRSPARGSGAFAPATAPAPSNAMATSSRPSPRSHEDAVPPSDQAICLSAAASAAASPRRRSPSGPGSMSGAAWRIHRATNRIRSSGAPIADAM